MPRTSVSLFDVALATIETCLSFPRSTPLSITIASKRRHSTLYSLYKESKSVISGGFSEIWSDCIFNP